MGFWARNSESYIIQFYHIMILLATYVTNTTNNIYNYHNSWWRVGRSLSSSCKAQYLKIMQALLVHEDKGSELLYKVWCDQLGRSSTTSCGAIGNCLQHMQSEGQPHTKCFYHPITPYLLPSILMFLFLGQLPSCSSNPSTNRSRRNIKRLDSTMNQQIKICRMATLKIWIVKSPGWE